SETFRPYNPGEAIGNTQPTVPSPPPPPKPKKKCGGIAQIVMIVVAIVVTVVVSYFGGPQAGAAVAKGFTALGASASTAAAAGTVATAATAAAAGSVASQLAGRAMGVVDSFSWSQVGISALSAGITAGVVGALAPAAGTAGTTGATATQGSWVTAAKEAIEKGGWAAKGVISGVTSYGSNYIANQVFGNNQSFSWASLGSSIVSSIVAAGMGDKGEFDGLGKAASPYAYSLAGANAAAVIDDKWFGGAKPNYLSVSMAAIANTIGRQFGEGSSSSQYKSNITVYNPATGERTALEDTSSLYAYSGSEFFDDLRNFNWSGIRDGFREEFSDYMPNNNQERMALMMGRNSDVTQLPTIRVQAQATDSIVYALGGVNSTYNMTAALGRVEERARLQREIDISNANNRRTWQEWADDANYSGSFTDAAKYVSRQTYLKVANFTTFGLYGRSDERLLQVRQGKLPPSLARRADLIEAGTGAAVTLAGAGIFNILRATGSAGLASMGAGRTAQYYGGSAIAGAGSGALMDISIQSAERINYDISGGITGRSEYDLGQIALSGAVGGVTSPLLGAIPAFANSKYNVNLQSPIYFETSAGRLNSGIPIEFRSPIIKEANSVLINSEIAALQRIATNNKSDLYWGSLRRAYQDARGQIDFAHIEADIDFSRIASKQVMGGHFSTSPRLKIIEGTEQIGQNGSIRAKVELLTIDGNFYTKTNNGGYSSMTPLTWSLAQAKGEMSLAWLNRSLVSGKTYEGKSGGLSFKFFEPNYRNVNLWRGYPEYTP
ncbi:hypothetical protein MCL27_16455, partial [Acinetobacter pittii]|uniref:hypothetical protein n=1 Tax=Acinetobacter pittii TaxID=48296 RepID=UPI003CC7F3A6|nr:hypothetical protein [Acinetobacter pittii]